MERAKITVPYRRRLTGVRLNGVAAPEAPPLY